MITIMLYCQTTHGWMVHPRTKPNRLLPIRFWESVRQ